MHITAALFGLLRHVLLISVFAQEDSEGLSSSMFYENHLTNIEKNA